MNKIEKIKLKFPIGSIIKHKHCNIMYKIIDYKFELGHVNCYGFLSEHTVFLETLYYPKKDIGKIKIFYIDILKEFMISNLDYLSILLNERDLKELTLSKTEKFIQLSLF